MDTFLTLAAFVCLGITALTTIVALILRRTVPANEIHVIQFLGKTISYGEDTGNGSTYYEWPTWVPILSFRKTVYRVPVFSFDIDDYRNNRKYV